MLSYNTSYLLCYVLFLYPCFSCTMETPAVPTTIHCSPESHRGTWHTNTKHDLIQFFLNHVNQHCCLVWGVYEKYRKQFLPKLSPNTNQRNLKKIVDSNFEYVKPTILSMMDIDPSLITFNSREEGRERVVAHLLKERKNRTNGRLRRGEITNASHLFRLSITEVKNVWQEYIRKEREEKKKTTTSIGAGSSGTSLLDDDSLCHTLLTQDTTMREEDGELSLLPH